MIKELLKYKHSAPTRKPNFMLIPVTTFSFDSTGIEKFNEIYNWISNSNYNSINRTASGGISYTSISPCYDVTNTTSMIEITILNGEGGWRLQLRAKQKGQSMYGRQAYTILKRELLKDGIVIEDYFIDNGLEEKFYIEKPMIKLVKESYQDVIFENAHHIDFHSSYAAGLMNCYPEFAKTLKRLYALRKKKPHYKTVLNASIGYFQSEKINYQLAHLSRAAISDNNKRLKTISYALALSGRTVIAYNTDGLWYTGDIYHGPNEGPLLGQWENDKVNCKLRFKSAGSYEYILDGVYKPVVRGFTLLDEIKDRDEWEWGDIYNISAEPIRYIFDLEKGVIKNG